MGLIQSGYRILSEEGLLLFLKKASDYCKNRIQFYVPWNLWALLLPKKMEVRINDVEATFDMSVVNQNMDFRRDLQSERSVIESFITDLESDDIVYDIGANVGIYSVFAAKCLDDGEVIAFEPHPVATPALYRNLSTNSSNFEVVQLGIGANSGFGKMGLDLHTDADTLSESGINIRIDAASDIILGKKFPKPNVVKVDVEGAELNVLKGFGETLTDLDLMYVEVHHLRGKKFSSDIVQIRAILEKYFDSVVEIEQHDRGGGTQTHIKATSR